ncbi:MAG TPA: GspMb/PilO family protein, partial [Bryobacteraceae bacterium]|nr:GspMb/PilO family protein [Bryobacteraceae bacterium]
MRLGKRDRRALALLGAAALVMLLVELAVRQREQAPATASEETVASLQTRLRRMRETAATLPGRESALRIATQELAERAKGVIETETLPQAQAQLMQIARNLAAAQAPPIEIRNVEVGQARVFSDHYGEVLVPMTFECRIEQLVNLLADVSAQGQLVAVSGLRVAAG